MSRSAHFASLTLLAVAMLAASCNGPKKSAQSDPPPGAFELIAEAAAPTRYDLGDVAFVDDRHLITRDGTLVLWRFDAAAGTLVERGWFGWATERAPAANAAWDDGARERYRTTQVAVTAFALSHDGRWVIAGSSDGRLGLWHLTPDEDPVARKLAEIATGGGWVDDVAMTPDAASVAVTTTHDETIAELRGQDARGEIQLWRVDPAGAPHFSRTASHPVAEIAGTVAIAPDGRTAMTSGDELARVTVAPTGASSAEYVEQDGTWRSAAFSADGEHLVTGSHDAVEVWRVRPGQPVERRAVLHGHRGRIHGLAIARDGRWFASASALDGMLAVWPLAGLDPSIVVEPIVITSSPKDPYGVAISPSGHYLAASGERLHVWRLDPAAAARGASRTRARVSFEWARDDRDHRVRAIGWADDDRLVVVGEGGGVAVLDADDGSERTRLDPPAGLAAVSAVAIATTAVFVGREDGRVEHRSLDGKTAWVSSRLHEGAVTRLAAARSCVVSAADREPLRFWRSAGSKLEAAGQASAGTTASPTLAIAADQRFAAIAGSRGTAEPALLQIHPLDPATCAPRGTPRDVAVPALPEGRPGSSSQYPGGGGGPPHAMMFRPGSDVLVTAGSGSGAIVWKVASDGSLSHVEDLLGHVDGIRAFTIAPDGRQAVTAGGDADVILWRLDPAGAAAVQHLPAPAMPPSPSDVLAWSPDGKRVAIASHGGRVWMYRLE